MRVPNLILLVAAVAIDLSLAASPARATCLSPGPTCLSAGPTSLLPALPTCAVSPGPANPSGVGYHTPWFGGSAERWTPERAHVFVAGGYSVLSSHSINTWWLDGWIVTAGVELPVGQSWSAVPRLHLSGAGDDVTNVLWARLALDGRLSSKRGGILSYQEAGLGIGVLDFPVTVTNPDFTSRYERRSSGMPFFQLVAGLRGDPDDAPAFVTEMILVLGLGAERPSGLELVAGIEF